MSAGWIDRGWPPGLPPVPTTPIRIGDTERDQAVSALGDHFAAGRLTKGEFEERAGQAIQARFSSDLAPLFADLPRQQPVAATPSQAAGAPPWTVLAWLLPVLVVGAVAAAAAFHAPFLLWALIWVAVIGKLTGHRRRPGRYGPPPSGPPHLFSGPAHR